MWTTLSCCHKNRVRRHKNYVFQSIVGQGTFGVVFRCWNKKTHRMEAIKISKASESQQELKMLEECRRHNLHEHNIVRLLNSFPTTCGPALVMENLDITLAEYFHDMKGDELMTLSDIRCIIKQMAVALDAVKNIGVIHTDIKTDNIMIANRHERPFRVKLIDFGLAIHRNETRLGMHLQNHLYRAPETILGLPITEAIDMWSLGCVMAYMITRVPIFHGEDAHEIMQCIVLHCGQPEDHLLDEGLNTERHFSRTESNRWMIKGCLSQNNLSTGYPDVFTKTRFDNKTKAETLEAQQCLDLLMAMLTVDASERITPAEVLMHPFMTSETLSSGGDEASVSAPGDCTNIERDHHSPSTTITLPRLIHVRPAKAEKTQRSEDTESSDSLHIQAVKTSRPVSSTSSSDCEDPATRPKTTNIQPAHHSPSTTVTLPRVIHVQPAKAENTWRLEDHDSSDSLHIQAVKTSRPVSSTSSSDCEDPATHPKTTDIQPAHHSPSTTITLPRVIHVQPARAENTWRLEDHGSSDSLHIQAVKTSRPVSSTSSSDCEDPATHPKTTDIQPAHHSLSTTITLPRVIHVQPARAENTLRLEDHDSSDSLQAGLVTTTVNGSILTEDTSTSTSEDFPTCVKKQLPPPPVTELSSKKEKKKKNCFRRFFSWMKKTFCPCMTCVDDEKE